MSPEERTKLRMEAQKERMKSMEAQERMRRELVAKYPSFFHPKIPQDLDLGHGAGWKDLLDQLAQFCLKHDPNAHFGWSKEKFGAIRISVQTTAPLHLVSEELERLSKSICECCGEPGHRDQYGMLWATRCADHGLLLAQQRGCDEMISTWEKRKLSIVAPAEEKEDDDGGLRL